jgi:benzoyl-CoA reductase/2-hydroxyglutaryl-CoA dehydratase subunit BcrC/BadD/HgdB
MVAKVVEDAGFRFLNLNGDAADERNAGFEQARTRLEAFLETM